MAEVAAVWLFGTAGSGSLQFPGTAIGNRHYPDQYGSQNGLSMQPQNNLLSSQQWGSNNYQGISYFVICLPLID